MNNDIKDLNLEVKYYLKALAKELLNEANNYNVENTKDFDPTNSNLVDAIKYVCEEIAINDLYTKNNIKRHFLKEKSDKSMQSQLWKMIEKSALQFTLRFARLRKSKVHKDIHGNKHGKTLDNSTVISVGAL